MRILVAVFLLLSAFAARADVPGARLWLDVETQGRAPYAQEMVLLRIRGLFTLPILLEKLEQPDMPGFRWLPIGGDIWTDASDGGRKARGFQRTLALFPQRAGELAIPAFVHRLTVMEAGERRNIEISTKPLSLRIAAAPDATGQWWLPAQSVSISESWSVPPEALAIGQSTRRTVTVQAFGVPDDQLPPLPELRVPGLIAFPAPPERRTVISVSMDAATAEQRRQALRRPGRLATVAGPDGPRSTVIYSWDIRPTTDGKVTLPAISLPWFDTVKNMMATAYLPPRLVQVDLAGPALAKMEAELGITATEAGAMPFYASALLALLAGIAGFALTWRLVRASTSRHSHTSSHSHGWSGRR
ncbi:MAG TPA: hypothetical protein VIQ29_08920 [Ancylobacter sp.]